jgi:diadenosine tetraphosphate (Ap4A) HIT family hydrolase
MTQKNQAPEREEFVLAENQNTKVELCSILAEGHVKVRPKQECKEVPSLPDQAVIELFQAANVSSTLLFEILKPEGTNIILNETDNQLCIDVIPRKTGDGLKLAWDPKKLSEEEMSDAQKRISEAMVVEESDTPQPTPKQQQAETLTDQEDYLVKSLERIP